MWIGFGCDLSDCLFLKALGRLGKDCLTGAETVGPQGCEFGQTGLEGIGVDSATEEGIFTAEKTVKAHVFRDSSLKTQLQAKVEY